MAFQRHSDGRRALSLPGREGPAWLGRHRCCVHLALWPAEAPATVIRRPVGAPVTPADRATSLALWWHAPVRGWPPRRSKTIIKNARGRQRLIHLIELIMSRWRAAGRLPAAATRP